MFSILFTLPVLSQNISLKLIWSTPKIFDTPESVIYSHTHDLIFVSNILGKSAEKDGKGYISKLKPNGEIIQKHWISGIDATKGMAIHKNKLYVSNIDELIEIDIEQQKIIHKYHAEGGMFLNDVAIAEKW